MVEKHKKGRALDCTIHKLSVFEYGFGTTLATPFLLAKYGSILGPKGALIGAGVGFAFVGGEYLYDNRHVPAQTYQQETSRFKRFYNRLKYNYNSLEYNLKHWANPYRR